MGRAVVYCCKCQTRLTGAEFDQGKAFEAAGVFVCAPCLEKLPPDQKESFRPRSPEPPPAPDAAPRPVRGGSGSRLPRASRQGTPVWLFTVGGMGLLAIVALVMLSLDRSAPPPRPKADPEPPAPPVSAVEPVRPTPEEPRRANRAEPSPVRATPRETPAAAPPPAVSPPPAVPPAPVAPPPAAPPPPPPKLYPPVWEAARPLAAAREYARAVAEIERALPSLKDPAEQAEAAADLDRLRRARAMLGETYDLLARWPAGRKLQAAAFDEKGAARTVDAASTRAGPGWMELKKDKETFVVLAGEILPSSLAEIYKARAKEPDPKGGAAFLFLEGADGAARKLFGADPAESEKVLISSRAPENPARESEARRLFYSAFEAERDLQEGQRRTGCLDRYASLLKDYADTGFVRRNRELIMRRSEPVKEYVFLADDFRPGAGFRPSTAEKVGACWMAAADAREAWMDLEFQAVPDTAYRGWVYAGACCLENFRLALQAEPEASASLKPPSSGFPRSHAPHANAAEPPRWVWVSFALPKGAGGRKKIRLLAERPGAAVAYGMISATRQTAPSDAYMKELRKSQPEAPAAPAREAGLVGLWNFDEGSGTAANDSSGHGHHGKLTDGVSWVPGKIGTALQFDGVKGQVIVPDAPALRLPGDLTICFWMKKVSEPAEFQRLVGKGDATRRNFNVWEHEGPAKNLVFQQFDTSGKSLFWLGTRTGIEPGNWTHVAAVIGGTAVTIYVNGRADATGTRGAGEAATSADPLTFGYGFHGHYPGFLDEVRLYNRALSAPEVQALHERQR